MSKDSDVHFSLTSDVISMHFTAHAATIIAQGGKTTATERVKFSWTIVLFGLGKFLMVQTALSK